MGLSARALHRPGFHFVTSCSHSSTLTSTRTQQTEPARARECRRAPRWGALAPLPVPLPAPAAAVLAWEGNHMSAAAAGAATALLATANASNKPSASAGTGSRCTPSPAPSRPHMPATISMTKTATLGGATRLSKPTPLAVCWGKAALAPCSWRSTCTRCAACVRMPARVGVGGGRPARFELF